MLFGYLLVAILVGAAAVAVNIAFSTRGSGQAPNSVGAGHVHGLGVNPADGALFVASHNGLLRVAAGEAKPRPVGEEGKDVMGFSVVGPDRFLGSGHPGDSEKLPSNLGLIASRDGGRTFKPVSLLGEADFHLLRAVGTHVYGFDSSSGRFLVSRDGGRSWGEQPAPGALIDLSVDRTDPDRLVASTDSGLFSSDNGGRRWSRLGRQMVLIAWPAAERLFILDQEGRVSVSEDGGGSFRPAGEVPGEPVAFLAVAGELYVALADNRILRSTDAGATWSLRTEV